MAFQQTSAVVRPRLGSELSADNTVPDRFTLIETLRQAAPALPFGPSIIGTIDALLSCLPPKRTHHLVFASNATLVMRRNGISDRTLRRHLAELIEAGLLHRIDSPNGKRYSKRDPAHGTVLRFGLDLGPLFAAFDKLLSLAAAAAQETARKRYLHSKILAVLHQAELSLGPCPTTDAARKTLRRKLSIVDLEALLKEVSQHCDLSNAPAAERHETIEMSASNSQNVRHHQNSKKEHIDNRQTVEVPARPARKAQQDLTLATLLEACPQAASYLAEKISSVSDVVQHAQRLAPMIGIDRSSWDAAEQARGPVESSLVIWGMLEILHRIRQPGAYFRAVTSGSKQSSFDPWGFIRRLMVTRTHALENCPRTTVM